MLLKDHAVQSRRAGRLSFGISFSYSDRRRDIIIHPEQARVESALQAGRGSPLKATFHKYGDIMNESSIFRQVTEEAKKRREELNENAKARKASEIAGERAQNAQRAKACKNFGQRSLF